MSRRVVFGLLLLTACSASSGKQRGDGTFVFDCSEHKRCYEAAGKTCGDQGYLIVGGKSNKKKYGTPGNEVYVGKDEIYVRCNRDRPADAPSAESGDWSLRRSEEGKPGTGTPAAASKSQPVTAVDKPAPAVCRPGETQRCVGPGACDGGQACLMDGTAYGPCDCGAPTVRAGTGAGGEGAHTTSSASSP